MEYQTQAPPPPTTIAPRAIAPWWHTAIFLFLILGVSLLSAFKHVQAPQDPDPGAKTLTYVLAIVQQWVLLFLAWLGFRQRVSIRELIGGRWKQVEDVLLDVVIAVAFWVVAMVVIGSLGYAMGLTNPSAAAKFREQVKFVVPESGSHLALFFALSLSAGICEELVFRGYLQRQFAFWTRSASAGVALQAIVFGMGHGYQGPKRMLLITIFGAMFGVLAQLRRNLRPAMIAHTMHDGIVGAVLRYVRL